MIRMRTWFASFTDKRAYRGHSNVPRPQGCPSFKMWMDGKENRNQ